MSVTVLTHLPVAGEIRSAVPEVTVVEIPGEGELDDDVRGEVLYTIAWPPPNIVNVLDHGVRWIHTMGTGVDLFPLEVISDQVLTCSRGVTSAAHAEWVLGMMLAYEKQFPESWADSPESSWHSADLGTLDGRTLGLVGLGTIGSGIADRALSFGMQVVAHRRTNAPAHRPEIEVVHTLDEVLERADHLVLAAPGTAKTRHLLNASTFAKLKPGAHFVNVARGSLVDEDALHVALDNGQVAMASLDAYAQEPLPEGHWMYAHPRVRVSPHISWSRPGAPGSLIEMFIANLRRYLAGEPLHGIVNVAEAY